MTKNLWWVLFNLLRWLVSSVTSVGFLMSFSSLKNRSNRRRQYMICTYTDFLNHAKFDAYGLSHRYLWSLVKSFWNDLNSETKIENWKEKQFIFLVYKLIYFTNACIKVKTKKNWDSNEKIFFEHYILTFFSFNFFSLLDFSA